MSRQDDPDFRQAQAQRLLKAWKTPTGWRYWSAVNNTQVGLWYTIAAGGFFLFAGVLALLMRLQLAVPGNDFMTAETYNQAFTLHGSIMMFLFAVPIFEAFSIYILPQMLGSRDLPFPRLSAYGFWSFVLGGTFVSGSILFDAAPRGGWFMYPPLTSAYQPGIGADIWLLGLSFIEIAAVAAAIELIVGILKCRPPGMRINLIPLYTWYILAVAVMILFAFPPLIAGDLMLELQRAFDWPFFDPARGGDPLLWQHLFWIFGHPEVYIILLPAVALVAVMVPTFARRPIIGYGWIVLAALGTAFISFGLWVHHMYTTGIPALSLSFFSGASVAVAIPTGVQIFCFIATILAGRLVASVPMLFVGGALAVFVLGGLTGVMVAIVPFDFQVHDTYFIVAHFHYVLIGGVVFPLIGAVHYFFPLAAARSLSERWGRVSFWLIFAGFNIAFMPMHLSGLWGMPRRVFTYPAGLGLEVPNMVSTIGAFTLAAGLAVLVADIIRSLRGKSPRPERNPWQAGSLEWVQEMPGKPWGIRSVPIITTRYPLWDQPDLLRDIDEGRFYLPDAPEMQREALATSTIDARPVQCLRLPGPSFLPLLSAVFTGGLFIFATFHWWFMALASGATAMALILTWLWTGTGRIAEKPTKDVGLGLTLPLYGTGSASPGWWAIFIAMVGDITAFSGLVFGYFFFWTIHDDFPPGGAAGPGQMWPLIALGLIAASWLLTIAGRRFNAKDSRAAVFVALGLAVLCDVAGGLALAAGPWSYDMDPTHHAYQAIVWVIVLWGGLHIALGAIMHLYVMARLLRRHMNGLWDVEIQVTTLYWHFLTATIAVSVAVIGLFPLAAS